MLDLTEELYFEFKYKNPITEEKSSLVLDAFIAKIEENSLYYGGGSDLSYLRGCLDLTVTKLSKSEVIDLLKAFAAKYDFIDSVKYWDNL